MLQTSTHSQPENYEVALRDMKWAAQIERDSQRTRFPVSIVRVDNLGSISRFELHDALSAFGPICEINQFSKSTPESAKVEFWSQASVDRLIHHVKMHGFQLGRRNLIMKSYSPTLPRIPPTNNVRIYNCPLDETDLKNALGNHARRLTSLHCHKNAFTGVLTGQVTLLSPDILTAKVAVSILRDRPDMELAFFGYLAMQTPLDDARVVLQNLSADESAADIVVRLNHAFGDIKEFQRTSKSTAMIEFQNANDARDLIEASRIEPLKIKDNILVVRWYIDAEADSTIDPEAKEYNSSIPKGKRSEGHRTFWRDIAANNAGDTIYDVSASAGSAKFYPSGEKSTQDAIPSEQLVVVSKLHPKQSWNGIAKDFLFAESLGTINVREGGCLTKNAYLRFPSAGAAKECIARANDVGIIAKNVRLGVRMATAEEHLTWANREVKGNSVTPNTAASNVVMGEHTSDRPDLDLPPTGEHEEEFILPTADIVESGENDPIDSQLADEPDIGLEPLKNVENESVLSPAGILPAEDEMSHCLLHPDDTSVVVTSMPTTLKLIDVPHTDLNSSMEHSA